MASIDDSGSPQYRVFQPVPNGLSNKQRDKHLQNVVVDDLRSAFVLIAELQKTVTDLTLQNLQSATSPTVSTPSTTLGTPSTVRMASTPGKLAGSPYSATPGLRTWVLDVRVLSYVQMWHQMWVLKPNQDS